MKLHQAHEHEALNAVELLDQHDLAELLGKREVMMPEVQRMLFAEWPSEATAP